MPCLQVTISYLRDVYWMPTRARQLDLMKNWLFLCGCQRCAGPDILRRLPCPRPGCRGFCCPSPTTHRLPLPPATPSGSTSTFPPTGSVRKLCSLFSSDSCAELLGPSLEPVRVLSLGGALGPSEVASSLGRSLHPPAVHRPLLALHARERSVSTLISNTPRDKHYTQAHGQGARHAGGRRRRVPRERASLQDECPRIP